MHQLGDLIQEVGSGEPVEPSSVYDLAGVRWYGEGVFLRETIFGRESSAAALTRLVPGALIYNRMFAWKGAFGVVSEDCGNLWVSSEFPQFVPRNSEDLADYLHLLLTRPHLRGSISSLSTGSAAVSRNRLNQETLLRLVVPTPSKEERAGLVRRWKELLLRQALAHEEAARIRFEADEAVYAALGLQRPEVRALASVFSTNWSDMERWGLRANQMRASGLDLESGFYPVVELREVVPEIRYGTSAKATVAEEGLPVLRIGNIKGGAIDLRDLKFADLGTRERASLTLLQGDILVIRTSGSRDLVGTTAVFRESKPFVFASYLLRLRADTGKVVPEFLSWFLNSDIGRAQIDALSRQIMQTNINSEELRSIRLTRPPTDAQEQFMNERKKADSPSGGS